MQKPRTLASIRIPSTIRGQNKARNSFQTRQTDTIATYTCGQRQYFLIYIPPPFLICLSSTRPDLLSKFTNFARDCHMMPVLARGYDSLDLILRLVCHPFVMIPLLFMWMAAVYSRYLSICLLGARRRVGAVWNAPFFACYLFLRAGLAYDFKFFTTCLMVLYCMPFLYPGYPFFLDLICVNFLGYLISIRTGCNVHGPKAYIQDLPKWKESRIPTLLRSCELAMVGCQTA